MEYSLQYTIYNLQYAIIGKTWKKKEKTMATGDIFSLNVNFKWMARSVNTTSLWW